MRFPIHEYLVPQPNAGVEDGFTRQDVRFLNGLPHRIVLEADIDAVVLVANGVANTWRDTDPEWLVDHSGSQTQPRPEPDDAAAGPALSRVPALLIVRSGRVVRAVLPLIAGLRQTVDISGNGQGALLEFHVLDWTFHAGNLRGAGDFGGRLRLAWRHSESAVAHFSTPPVNPYLKPRLQLSYRMVSTLGLRRRRVMARFSASQRVLKLRGGL